MRKPQRNFVVEFKTSRSPLKSPARSIWGDTDLKAIAVLVEDSVPMLERASVESDKTNRGPHSSSKSLDCEAALQRPKILESLSFVEKELAVPETGEEKQAELEARAHPVDPTMVSQASGEKGGKSPGKHKSRNRPPQPEAALVDAAENTQVVPRSEAGSDQIVSMDHLANLQSEYARLLCLAADKLRMENRILKAELERLEQESKLFDL